MVPKDVLCLSVRVSVHQEQPKNQLDGIFRFDFCRAKDVALGELAAVCIDVADKVRARKRKHIAFVRKRIGRGGQLGHVAERLQVGRHNILVVEVAAGILCGKLQLAHKIQRRR